MHTRTRRCAALAIALATLTIALPPSQAEETPPPLRVTTAPYHVGDRWQIDRHATSSAGEEARASIVAHVEGHARAADKYGIERETVAVRADWYGDGRLWSQQRCHVLRGGEEAVREDFLYVVVPFERPLPVVDLPVARSAWSWESVFTETCDLPIRVSGRAVEAGERVAAADVAENWRWEAWPSWRRVAGLSTPAEPADFHGRPALRFSFALEAPDPAPAWLHEGRLEMMIAEGLPGIVWSRFVGTSASGEVLRLEDALVAFAPGEGATVADEGAQLPARDPRGEFLPFDPLAFDDDAWRLPYPFADAMRALREDPRGDLARFLAQHADAVLAWADHMPTRSADADVGFAWSLGLTAPGAGRDFTTRRVGGSLLPGLELNDARDAAAALPAGAPLPERVASSATLAAAGARAGLPPEATTNVGFWIEPTIDGGTRSVVYLTDYVDDPTQVAASDFRLVFVDRESGGLSGVTSVRVTSEIGRVALPPDAALRAPAEPLVPPEGGIGPAAALAGGLAALLAVLGLGRLALPLFTRIQRDRLLQDPTRAKLFAAIRARPGLHEAALAQHGSRGTVRHHLDKLRRSGLVFVAQDGGFSRYYPAGGVPPEATRAVAALQGRSAQAVYELFRDEPGVTLREASRRLGISAPSVHRAKRRLEREGLLVPTGGVPQ